MSVEEYRMSRKRNNYSKRKNIGKRSMSIINKIMLTIVIFLIGLIVSRNNTKVKEFINKNIYTPTFKFIDAKKFYNKYFGKYVGEKEKTKEVFTEKISYSGLNVYKDGVKLKVSQNYLVPALESGIVIFMGEKEGYGKTLIIEQINGIDVWYSNINVKDVKMYDYVEKGALIGESIDDKIYLLFQKNGEFLSYKEYI